MGQIIKKNGTNNQKNWDKSSKILGQIVWDKKIY